jgi:hypothetical protein
MRSQGAAAGSDAGRKGRTRARLRVERDLDVSEGEPEVNAGARRDRARGIGQDVVRAHLEPRRTVRQDPPIPPGDAKACHGRLELAGVGSVALEPGVRTQLQALEEDTDSGRGLQGGQVDRQGDVAS